MDENQIHPVTELGSSVEGDIHCLAIIGQIEGHMVYSQ